MLHVSYSCMLCIVFCLCVLYALQMFVTLYLLYILRIKVACYNWYVSHMSQLCVTVLYLWIARVSAVCDYNGVQYNQGQTWDDGCSRRCRCEDAVKGLYVCEDRYVSTPSTYTESSCSRTVCLSFQTPSSWLLPLLPTTFNLFRVLFSTMFYSAQSLFALPQLWDS